MAADSLTTLVIFVQEQQQHWKRLRKGIIPEDRIIDRWIESCDFALEDLRVLCMQALKEGD